MSARYLLAIFIFCLVFVVHTRSLVIVSTDSMWSIYLAQSFLKDGDLVLDEYKELAKKRKNYGLRKRKGELYSYFPVGTALMAVPFVCVYNNYPQLLRPFLAQSKIEEYPTAEDLNLPLQRVAASFFVALAVLFLFFMSRQLSGMYTAFALSLIAAFATPFWSTASRGLWQHGPSALLVSASLLILYTVRKRPDLAGLTGFLLAFAYIVRPTNAVVLLLTALYLLWQQPRALFSFSLSAAIVFIPFIACSYSFLDRFLPPYYLASRLQLGWHFPQAFLANLFSPNRGIFFLSPILIPALIEMISLCRKILSGAQALKTEAFSVFVLLCFAGHLTAVSLFPEWWGGHAFGPRYMCETVPYLIYFMALWLSKQKLTMLRLCLLTAASCFSVFVHYQGASHFETYLWNIKPVNIDREPGRVWDFSDLQFLRQVSAAQKPETGAASQRERKTEKKD